MVRHVDSKVQLTFYKYYAVSAHGWMQSPWWRHQWKHFSASPAICSWNSPVYGEFPTQGPATRSFEVFFDLCLNEQLSKHSWGWWLDTIAPIMTSQQYAPDIGKHSIDPLFVCSMHDSACRLQSSTNKHKYYAVSAHGWMQSLHQISADTVSTKFMHAAWMITQVKCHVDNGVLTSTKYYAVSAHGWMQSLHQTSAGMALTIIHACGMDDNTG